MTNSPEFGEFKGLYHDQESQLKEVSVSSDSGRAVFEKNGNEREVTGESSDFLETLINIRNTVRQGEELLIDVRETPAGSANTFERNKEYFIPDSNESPKSNIGQLPEPINLKEALDASVELDLENSHLHTIVKNYHQTLAIQRQAIGRYASFLDTYKSKSYDSERFNKYYSQIESVLRLCYLTKNHFDGYREYRDVCTSDVEFLGQQLTDYLSADREEWKAIGHLNPPDSSDKPIIHHPTSGRQQVEPGSETGKIDGQHGIRRLTERYAKHFEFLRDPLKDVANTLISEYNKQFNHISPALEFLDDNDEQDLTKDIIPELRHGSSHLSTEFDDSEGVVRIYSGRAKNRKIDREVQYETVIDSLYSITDLSMAIVIAFTLFEQLLIFEYLRSPEFKYRMIENIAPGQID